MQEIITEGKTLVEAVDKACRELGVSRDDVTYEVLVQPVKKLFKTIPARVKVSVRGDDISVRDLLRFDDLKKEEEKQPEEPVAEPEAKNAVAESVAEPAVADVTEHPRKEGSSHKRRRKKKPNRDNQPKPAEQQEIDVAEPVIAAVEQEPIEEIALDDLPVGAKAAFDYLKTVAAGLGANALEYKAVKIRDGVKFIIDGDDAAALIGRRGETMDALQYLCLLVSNRASDDYCKIAIDVASYRNKREKTLEALAKKVANTVLKTRYSKTLEPMNPYERRIVHSTIQGIEGVKSESVGQEPNRRVVILLENGGKEGGGKDRRKSGRSGKSHGSRDNRARRERRESDDRPAKQEFEFNEIDLQQPVKEYQRIDMKTQAPQPVPQPQEPEKEEKKNEDKNLSLYSRIDL